MRQAVERLAARLRESGLNVWFDASMSAGETFNSEIDREARAAKAILVCWSPTARESRWVIAEAMIGFEQDKLAACHVAGPDGFSPPTPFNTSHTEDLRAWLASPSDAHAGWRSVLRRLGKLCGRTDIESYGALDVQASAPELRAWIAAHEKSPLFMAVDTLLRTREAEEAQRARLEQEARERRAREERERQARAEEQRRAREEAERRACEEETRRQAEREREAEEEARRRAEQANRGRGARRAFVFAGVTAAVVALIMIFGVPVLQRQAAERAAENYVPTSPILGHGEDAGALADLTTFRDCADCPEMVVIPAGSFTMGSPESESGRFGAEGPQHSVTVDRFAVGKFEVTFDQWAACVSGSDCTGDVNDSGWGRARRPVIYVLWDDAQQYVQWLSQATGQNYRLLSEAEWEYAARAGTTTRYSWSDQGPECDPNARNGANFYLCTDDRTRPVGSFPAAANAFGLYDMHGNVWEWVQDCWNESYNGAPANSTSWTSGDCSYRVLRGGSWSNNPRFIRSAYRDGNYPTLRNNFVGFRVARTL